MASHGEYEAQAKEYNTMRNTQPYEFDSKVNKTYTCWLWDGPISDGYGIYCQYGITWKAHIFSYIRAGKVIPKDHDLHHTCSNKNCVNPDHLKPLTHRRHAILESSNRVSKQRFIGLCRKGHEMTEENTYRSGGYKFCRTCQRRCEKRYRERQNKKE